MREIIENFLEQAKTDNLKTKQYPKEYQGLKVKVSFGAGNTARIPWVALLKAPNKVQDGIYPVFLYFKEIGTLILAYGVSETTTSSYSWNNLDTQSITQWYKDNHDKTPDRYGQSKVKAIYDVSSIDYKKLEEDVNDIIKEYEMLDFSQVPINEPSEPYHQDKVEKYLSEFADVAEEWFEEQDWLEERYNFFKGFFNLEKIKNYNWEDFQKLKENLHSFTSMPLAGGNALGRMNLPLERYREIFEYIISRTDSIDQTIDNLFEKHKGSYHLPYFGESTVTELIQYAFPREYVVYNSRTENALKILGVKFSKKRGETIGQKFKRFNETIQFIKEKYSNIVGERTNTTLPLEVDQFFSWLSVNHSEEENTNYWVFQGNPSIYNITAAIENNDLNTWSVKAHKSNIHKGDKVIIWVTGSNSGCYGLGEVSSEVYFGDDDSDEIKYYTNQSNTEPSDRVKIEITDNYFDNPILKNELSGISIFKDFKGGNQGTNFSATKEQFEYLKELRNESDMEGDFFKVKNSLPPEEYTKFIEILKSFVNKHSISPHDKRFTFNVRTNRNRLAFLIGSRYALTIERKGNTSESMFISPEILSDDHGAFKKGTNEHYQVYWNNVKTLRGFEDEIFGGLDIELENGYQSNFRKHTNQDFMKAVFDDYEPQTEKEMDELESEIDSAKNLILYGPPGTGKTYTLKESYFPRYTSKETSISKDVYFESVVKDCSWWQVIAVALIELGPSKVADIYNHPWVQMRAELSNSNSVRPTIWAQLQRHTIDECEYVNVKTKLTPLIFNKRKDSLWEIDKELVNEVAPEIYDLMDSVNNYNPNPYKEFRRYKFVTFHQSFAYEDFVEGIKPILPEEDDVASDLGYTIEPGVFMQICKEAEKDSKNRYAIFIDEINRGNVSAIFGELITLIEPDKRKGSENEIQIVLPYSKKLFCVPSNLDIYGTMNTADRSVEALDTALRRRFTFKEIMPKPELLSGKIIGNLDLSAILDTINQRVELLVDRDHTIGHSYFINVTNEKELALTFNDKIVPLLQEYFYGDYGKIGLVLGKGFVKKINNNDKKFAPFDYEGQGDFKTPSFELNKVNENNIIEALQKLMGIEETSS